jgi:hypothetical protein
VVNFPSADHFPGLRDSSLGPHPPPSPFPGVYLLVTLLPSAPTSGRVRIAQPPGRRTLPVTLPSQNHLGRREWPESYAGIMCVVRKLCLHSCLCYSSDFECPSKTHVLKAWSPAVVLLGGA